MDQPTAVPEVSEETKLSRRRVLKIAAATGGAVAASTLIPNKWVKPVVEVGLLPAHAQISFWRAYWTGGTEEDCCGENVVNGHAGYVLRLDFTYCTTEETTSTSATIEFSGGSAGEECYDVVDVCNGGAVSSLNEVFAQIGPGCHDVCLDLCIYFDQRTTVTFTFEVCEGTDCVQRSVTLHKPD